jgi:hypothetical protein
VKKWLKYSLIFGIIVAAFGMLGLQCRWNPVEGSVIPNGICKSGILLYLYLFLLLVPQLAVIVLFEIFNDSGLFNELSFKFVFIPLYFIAIVFFYIILFRIVSWIYGLIRNRINSNNSS